MTASNKTLLVYKTFNVLNYFPYVSHEILKRLLGTEEYMTTLMVAFFTPPRLISNC